MANVFDGLIEKARNTGKRIILTETEDERVLQAAETAAATNLCKVVLLGARENLEKRFSSDALNNISFTNVETSLELQEKYSKLLYELRKAKGMTEEQARAAVKNKLTFAMLMIKSGDADGVVSGAITHTADVLRPAFQIVKVKPGVSKVSSVFIMESPSKDYGENGFLAQPGEWYDKLEYLYQHPEENRRVAKNARKYALKHYYGKEFLKEVEKVYDAFLRE